MPFDPSKLAKLQAQAKALQTGGKGTVRRKKAVVHKVGVADDKRLKSTLAKLNVRDIPAIEEVNLFKEDGNVIHFVNPKVQASIAANTYVVTGQSETKKLADLLPGIITQLGPDNLNELKKIYAAYAGAAGQGGMGGMGMNMGMGMGGVSEGGDEDEIPQLVEDFESISQKGSDNASTSSSSATQPTTT